MSADNGIYIAKFPDGYRVAMAQCIENIDYYPAGTKERKEMLRDYFGESKVYKFLWLARREADRIERKWYKEEDEYGIGCPIEYGICELGEYESFEDA